MRRPKLRYWRAASKALIFHGNFRGFGGAEEEVAVIGGTAGVDVEGPAEKVDGEGTAEVDRRREVTEGVGRAKAASISEKSPGFVVRDS